MSDFDKKVVLILHKIENKKEELKKTEEQSSRKWNTNCIIPNNFLHNEGFSCKNLKTIGKEELLAFTANLIAYRDNQKSAAMLLNYNFDLKFNNFEYDLWFEDCKTRLATLILSEQKAKLKQLEDLAESLQSEELKKQKSLDKLEKELEDLN